MKFFYLFAIFVLNFPSAGLQLIPLRTMAERTSEKLTDAVADGAWLLPHHYVCRCYKSSQRGSGVGGIHTRHNAHQLYPVHPLKEHTGEQQAEERKEKPSVSIKIISPAQATLEQAQSELKKQNKQKRGRRNRTGHNAHQLYPVHPLKEHTGERQAEERKEKPSISIKMISPAQATLEQAQSELKKQNKQKRGRRNPVST